MNILYAMLLRIQTQPTESLISDVQMSLDVLRAMDSIQVARNYEQLTSEVLEVVKAQKAHHLSASSPSQYRSRQNDQESLATDLSSDCWSESIQHGSASNINPVDDHQGQKDMQSLSSFSSSFGDAFFAELIDSSLLGNISRLGDVNVGPGFLTAGSSHPSEQIGGPGGFSGDQNLDVIMGEENGVLIYSMAVPSGADQEFDFLAENFGMDAV